MAEFRRKILRACLYGLRMDHGQVDKQMLMGERYTQGLGLYGSEDGLRLSRNAIFRDKRPPSGVYSCVFKGMVARGTNKRRSGGDYHIQTPGT